MLTGVEITGIALAVFPIVVTGIQYYADGARTIKDMWRPEMALRKLSTELGMEECKFRNTCRSLLEPMVSASHLKDLMEEPGGPLWSAESLQEKLKSRLREDTVPYYMVAMERLGLELQKLRDEIGLNDKPELADKKALKKKLKKIIVVLSRTEYKELLASIAKINSDLAKLTEQCKPVNYPPQMAASENHYKRIRNHAINLYGVLKEKLQTAPACACTKPHNANLLLEARNLTNEEGDNDLDTSLRFHVVLYFENDSPTEEILPWNWREIALEPLGSKKKPRERDQASGIGNLGDPDKEGDHTDTNPHPTTALENTGGNPGPAPNPTSRLKSLSVKQAKSGNGPRLDQTTASIETPRGGLLGIFKRSGRKSTSKVSFNLSQPNCTNPTPITPDATPTHSTKLIDDLCLATQQATSDLTCFGILIDKSHRRYRVWPPRKPSFASEPTGVLSLESLLAQSEALNREDRLVLGVKLASTVMQLHATGWLGENWGKRDILFHQVNTQGENATSITMQPFVRRTFARQGPLLTPQTPQEPTQSVHVQHNRSLFSLGVILVELWYGRQLEDLRIEADGNGATNVTNFVTAWRLAGQMSEEAGKWYGGAVWGCINGLGHHPRDARLEKDDFRAEVHTKVVSPLVMHLKSFTGISLAEIL